MYIVYIIVAAIFQIFRNSNGDSFMLSETFDFP